MASNLASDQGDTGPSSSHGERWDDEEDLESPTKRRRTSRSHENSTDPPDFLESQSFQHRMSGVPSRSPTPPLNFQQPSSPQSQPNANRSASPDNPNGSTSEMDDPEESVSPDPVANLEQFRISQEFVDALRNASLDNSQLEPDDLDRLWNPSRESLDLTEDPDLCLSIDLFLAVGNASQETYNSARAAILRRHPNDNVLSYDQVKRCIKNITGIIPVLHDMCINSCHAFTGPFEHLEVCSICSEPRYDPAVLASSDGELKKPRLQFSTIMPGPQLQAQWAHPEGAKQMRYREHCVNMLLPDLAELSGMVNIDVSVLEDVHHGRGLMDAVINGRIKPEDMVLLFSMDGAQLYRMKKSDCWIYIWVILDLSPEICYKKKYVLPGGFIPGPNPPQIAASFIFPALYQLAALQREGLVIWDASRDVVFTSHPFLAFATADAVGMVDLNGWVGHHGWMGCRLMCGLPGRNKPGTPHYFPALLCPSNVREDQVKSNHPDIDINNLPSASTESYRENLHLIITSPNVTQYAARRRLTGISKPSIFDGLPRSLGVPSCFPGDLMHHIAINLPELLIGLWRGTFDCDKSDNWSTWEWATL